MATSIIPFASGRVEAINAAYYPSWRIYKQFAPSDLQVEHLTHVFYAFVGVKTDGSLNLLDEHADLRIAVDGELGCLRALAKLKRQHPHLKTVVSMGGGQDSAAFPAMASSPHARAKFATNVTTFIHEYSLDGVDIDWEHPSTPTEATNYLALLAALRSQLPSPRFLVTTALPASADCLGLLDLPRLAGLVDLVNLMGYDFTGPWTSLAGHHARLLPPLDPAATPPELRRSCHHGVDLLVAHGRFPRHKVVLGVPAYARYFPGARAAGHPYGRGHGVPGELDYCELPRGWITGASVDEDVGAACIVDEERGFVSFDVPATVSMKAGYVKAMGLGGLFYWTGAGDVPGEATSLVYAGWKGLREL